MNSPETSIYLSNFFIEDCISIFQTHDRAWWEKQRNNREGETCCLLYDLLSVIGPKYQIRYLPGLKVMAWWLFDRKYFDPERTVFFELKYLKEYQLIDYIWQLQELIGERAYALLYAYFHALTLGEDGPLESIKKEVRIGNFFSVNKKENLDLAHKESRAYQLKNLITSYLEVTRQDLALQRKGTPEC